jgi:hypothetical protein
MLMTLSSVHPRRRPQLGPGTTPDPEYGFSPADGRGNDVVINGPVCWSLKMHSRGNPAGWGNILLGRWQRATNNVGESERILAEKRAGGESRSRQDKQFCRHKVNLSLSDLASREINRRNSTQGRKDAKAQRASCPSLLGMPIGGCWVGYQFTSLPCGFASLRLCVKNSTPIGEITTTVASMIRSRSKHSRYFV